MDALMLLHDDHRRAGELLQRMQATSAEQVDLRMQLLALLQQELALHERVEDDVLCEALDPRGESEHRQVRLVRDRQGAVRDALAALVAADPSGPDWPTLTATLGGLFEQHVRDTEEGLFPGAHRLPAGELERMGDRIARERADLLSGY